MHGEELVFGNQGALYRRAMTWWDHETRSVWSQVTGEALFGPLRGERLEQIPAPIETWAAWRDAHPGTRVLELPGPHIATSPREDFVIGVRIGADALAFDHRAAAERVVQNDVVGEVPIAVYAGEGRLIRVFSREVAGRIVELTATGHLLRDPASGTTWDGRTGTGLSGPLSGEPLAPIAWMSSFDWAWLDFHPGSRIVR